MKYLYECHLLAQFLHCTDRAILYPDKIQQSRLFHFRIYMCAPSCAYSEWKPAIFITEALNVLGISYLGC